MTTLIHFDIALVFYVIINLINGYNYPLYNYIFCWIGWESIGNSNWYIFVILMLYIISFLSFFLSRNQITVLIENVLGTFLLIIFLRLFHKESWWYNTVLCYPFGMAFSYYKSEFENIMKKHYFILVVGATGIFTFLHSFTNQLCFMFSAVCFALIIVCLSYKIKIQNRLLYILGKSLFPIYILQRLPMKLFKGLIENRYCYIILCGVVTGICCYSFNFIISKTDSLLLNKKNEAKQKYNM